MEEGTAGDRQQANETNGGERGLQSSPDELVAESHEGASSPEVDLRVRVESLKGEKKESQTGLGEREEERERTWQSPVLGSTYQLCKTRRIGRRQE